MAESPFSNPKAVCQALKRALNHLIPAKAYLPTDWAEQNVKIALGNALPGPIRFDNAPYQRGMLDVIATPNIRRITYMTGAQLGKTTVQQCITAYFIAHDPRSQILLQPTQGDIQTFLETKLRPMLEANPKISQRMAQPRSREGVNNSRMISYIGGWLMFSWAGSPKTLRGRSAPIVQADEIDGMETTMEGDPVELLSQRAATFGDLSLRTESSTPTIKGVSRIEKAFLQGDQRRFYVACPSCTHSQILKWEQVQWQGKDTPEAEQYPETAYYQCLHCAAQWRDAQRIAAIRQAEHLGHGWKAEQPFRGHASFHAPELLSTFRNLSDIVQSYLDKRACDDLRSFINVSLAETYEEHAEKADPQQLMQRCEPYDQIVPLPGLHLTAGIDMQNDRLEVEIVAWGIGEESWSIDYRVLWGDPLAGEVWQDLDDLLRETWKHESGAELSLAAACLDTGGTAGYTQCAYEYARGKTGKRLFAIKGISGWGRPIVDKVQRKQSGKNVRKVDLFLVATNEAKQSILRRLARTTPGPGYCHFPQGRSEDYFKQLTAEKLVTRYQKGFPTREWQKPDHLRNEALDCRVYAFAALKIIPPNFKRIQERLVKIQQENFSALAYVKPMEGNQTTAQLVSQKSAHFSVDKHSETNASSVTPSPKKRLHGRRIWKPKSARSWIGQ